MTHPCEHCCNGCDECTDYEGDDSQESSTEEFGCCLPPGECCMPGLHFPSECHTAAAYEEKVEVMTIAQELKEYVSANGAENTTTYLMVQAVSEIERLQAGIAEIQRVLAAENDRAGGPICDTIWRGPGETLFDFIESLTA